MMPLKTGAISVAVLKFGNPFHSDQPLDGQLAPSNVATTITTTTITTLPN
jgi:hypothetical protein